MPIHLTRFAWEGKARWGVVRGAGIAPLEGDYPTTAALIERGEADWRKTAARTPSVECTAVEMLSPVTAPARVICQGANYRQHMIESGLNPDAKRFNMFFEKSDASISAPRGSIVRPAHVRLLDYEVELALVFKKQISKPVSVTPDNLHEHIFGLTIANDVSARDVQLPQTQFFKGKSYRSFCPLGPYLVVLEPGEARYLNELTLMLQVNDKVRQRDSTANLVYKPAETHQRAVHILRSVSGRRAAYGHAGRLRAPGTASTGAQGDAALALRATALGCVHARAGKTRRVPQAR